MRERQRETNRKTSQQRKNEKSAWGIKRVYLLITKPFQPILCGDTDDVPEKYSEKPQFFCFSLTLRVTFFLSLTQSSLRQRESVHLSSTQAQCSMCLCFPERELSLFFFLKMGVCFFWTNFLSNASQIQSCRGCNWARSLLFHNT